MTTVMELCSSAVRGVIVAPPGKKLVVADLAGIENRVLAWLAGESWKLDAFRAYDTITGHDEKGKPIRLGHDMYKLAYAKAFGISPDEVDSHMRQFGKVMELMLGYQGGVGAFLTGAATYNIDLEAMAEGAWSSIPGRIITEAQEFLEWQLKQGRGQFGLSDEAFIVCDSFKRLWRESNPNIVLYWNALDYACCAAVHNPGNTFTCRMHKIRRDGAWLRIRLPSGRYLCYPSPRVDENGKLSYMGIHQYSRKWCRMSTYGGKLAENITQGVARDVLGYAMPRIEAWRP